MYVRVSVFVCEAYVYVCAVVLRISLKLQQEILILDMKKNKTLYATIGFGGVIVFAMVTFHVTCHYPCPCVLPDRKRKTTKL